MKKALCIGDNCIDIYRPPLNQKFIGGNALNSAIHMKIAGCPSAYMGAVGSDDEGRKMLEALEMRGIDISHCQVFPCKTASTLVQLDPNGDRHFIHEDRGPIPSLKIDQSALEYIHQHELVHNTWLGATEDYLALFHNPGKNKISMDFGERHGQEFVDKTIRNVDIAFFSAAPGCQAEAENLCREMIERGPQQVVVTLGSGGSIAYDGHFYIQEAIQTEVIDTLGAGDTYIATFLAHGLEGKSIPECMLLAARAAARTCAVFGAWEGSLLVQ